MNDITLHKERQVDVFNVLDYSELYMYINTVTMCVEEHNTSSVLCTPSSVICIDL